MRFMTAAGLWLALIAANWTAACAADDVVIERVVGPEIPGRYKHPATIAEFDNGDLYIAYYGGAGEYEGDTAVYGMRLAKGSAKWTRPQIIADTPNRSDGNAAVWQAPDGVVWLFYVTNYGPTWSSARVKCKISKDRAQTWSDSDMLAFEPGSMARSRPILLHDGDYLLPLYHETGEDRERTAPDTCSYFLRYHPADKTWTPTNRIFSKIGNLQASPVQIDDDYVVAYIRRGGGFGPMKDGVLYRSESRDGGRTWSPGKETEFRNPNSAADFIKLKNGHLLLVFNDNNEGERMPLTVAISTDNDQSYPYRRDVVTKPGDDAAYPSAIQTQDGKVHVVYTSDERTVINRVMFDEEAILKAKPGR
ncbi:MAG: exo-alpha-sialidase [Pirellulales bacterium]